MRGTFVFEDPNDVVSRSEACNFVLSSKTVTCDFSMVRYLVRFICDGFWVKENGVVGRRWKEFRGTADGASVLGPRLNF